MERSEKIDYIETIVSQYNGVLEDLEKDIFLIKSDDDYYYFEDIDEAWGDFKGILSVLKENKIWIIYTDNEAPDRDFPEWSIYIDLSKEGW